MRPIGWLALAGCAAALSACGSGSKSATGASAPATTPTPPAQTAPSTSSTPATTTSSPAGSGGTEASTTRTATAPAFTSQPSSAEGLSAAVATVRAHGFTPVNTSDYHASQTLRVLIGSSGESQRAFFFVDGHYIGTDAKTPSAKLRVAGQSDTEVTLAYPLYRQGDAACCASAGEARVRFQLNNGKLGALDPIPPAGTAGGGKFAGLSRR